jgi:hypothetical protein
MEELHVMPHCCCTDELHVLPPTSMLESSLATMSLHSSKQQGDIALKAYVASVCFKYFICFIWMLKK